ncbi:MAG: rod-binding protein [Nitrospinaceae bacterium]|nr:MAG: rod-binding protein [Nitrospinaceae bacterium]
MNIHSKVALQDEALFRLSNSRLSQVERRAAQGSKTDAELMEVARQFEGIFIQYLQKAMRATVHKSNLFNSFSLDMYESMFDQELADQVSLKKGVGLADVLYRDLKSMDETIRRAQEAGRAGSSLFAVTENNENRDGQLNP